MVFQMTIVSAQKAEKVYETESLRIDKLTNNTYVHISYLETKSLGKVASNGMVVVNSGEAIVFDTPTSNAVSEELINWLATDIGAQVKAIVVTHFHSDCLGGLKEFHWQGIPSYANNTTIGLAESSNETLPQNGFDNFLELKVGKKKIQSEFMGEGHTVDNIIGYFPSEKVLFGGCLIKGNGAMKGYLGDANIYEWSNSVRSIKAKYNKAKVIIPGHGNAEGQNLLDFTSKLFDVQKEMAK